MEHTWNSSTMLADCRTGNENGHKILLLKKPFKLLSITYIQKSI